MLVLKIWPMILQTIGGLAFFLYGIDRMGKGIRNSFGSQIKKIFASVSQNRLTGLLLGVFITVILQSSNATTVILVSFVQASILTFTQTLAIILGANIGTTFTTHLLAFKITKYALIPIILGFLLQKISSSRKVSNAGEALLGIGFTFYGMEMIINSLAPIQDLPAVRVFITHLSGPFYGLLVGALFTGILQSSAAFTGILIAFSQQNLVDLDAAIPLVLGSNIGTCVAAILASLGTNRESKKVAMAHIAFKVLGAAIFLLFIPQFKQSILSISHAMGGMGLPREIAVAHTIFNVSLALMFLPFTTLFSFLLDLIVPLPKQKELTFQLKHLDNSFIPNPEFAFKLARKEISRMAEILGKMLHNIQLLIESNELRKDADYPQLNLLKSIQYRENKIEFLNHNISNYLFKVGREELTPDLSSEVFNLISLSNDLNSISNVIQKNMMSTLEKKLESKLVFSEDELSELLTFHLKICKQVSRIKMAFKDLNYEKTLKIIRRMQSYMDLETEYRNHHLERLRKRHPTAEITHQIHLELMEAMKIINVFTGNIAKCIQTLCKHSENQNSTQSS